MTGEGWRLAREAKGLTLRKLAQDAGISAPFLSDIEHGRRRFSSEVEDRVRGVLGLPAREPEPKNRCVVCEGPLETHQWAEPVGEPVFGAGGHYVTKQSIICPRCGLQYAHMPIREIHDYGATIGSGLRVGSLVPPTLHPTAAESDPCACRKAVPGMWTSGYDEKVRSFIRHGSADCEEFTRREVKP